jgi:hypothetical protein
MLFMIRECGSSASPRPRHHFVNHPFGVHQILALVKHRDHTCDHVFNSSTVHALDPRQNSPPAAPAEKAQLQRGPKCCVNGLRRTQHCPSRSSCASGRIGDPASALRQAPPPASRYFGGFAFPPVPFSRASWQHASGFSFVPASPFNSLNDEL